ncbi:MAG: hypothetical protein EOM12_15030 [Verrucomicrobiae bacterium]|nr:hypothetical protein [Verrucomicrobiae bacterium]
MKLKKSLLLAILCALIYIPMLTSCLFPYHKAPVLSEMKWESLYVEYIEMSKGESVRKSWTTNNKDVLNELRESLKVLDAGDLWGLGTMTSNKLRLTLVGGEEWVIYIVSKTSLAINKAIDPPTGFGLKVAPLFYDTLKKVIEHDEGGIVSFGEGND